MNKNILALVAIPVIVFVGLNWKFFMKAYQSHHTPAMAIDGLSCPETATEVGLTQISDSPRSVFNGGGDTGIALGRDGVVRRPANRLTSPQGPLRRERLHGVGEGVGGPRSIGTMHPGQGTGAAAELLPIGDPAAGDLNGLLLGQLQVAARLVVTKNNGGSGRGDLNHSPPHLGQVTGLHWSDRNREIHRLSDQGPLTRP